VVAVHNVFVGNRRAQNTRRIREKKIQHRECVCGGIEETVQRGSENALCHPSRTTLPTGFLSSFFLYLVSYIYIYFDQEDGRIVGAEGDRKDGVGGVIYQKKKTQ